MTAQQLRAGAAPWHRRQVLSTDSGMFGISTAAALNP